MVMNIRQRHLAMALSKLPEHPQNKAEEEQYATEGNLAAEWLCKMDGISGRTVADLGAGNGILGIGAHLLGADKVWLIEADPEVAEVARESSSGMQDVEVIEHRIDESLPQEIKPQTIIMNPPWGWQKKGADRPLLIAAMNSQADIIHLMHSAKAEHISGLAENQGWASSVLFEADFRLPARYEHHNSRSGKTPVKCWRLVRE